MPAYNECGIYDSACRERTCSHPTNPRNQGVQCRTMLSQRPCGARDCTREECSRARLSASVLMADYVTLMGDTKDDTENDVTGSESAPQTTGEGEPLYTLHSLTGADVARLEQALRMLRRIYTRDSEGYRAVSELGARVSALNWAE